MNKYSKGSPIDILLVEDNEADAQLTLEALSDAKVYNTVNIARDGEEAIAYLRKEEPYTDKTTPDLILLDLNLPKKDGRAVLEDIKNDEDLRKIPVVVLTSSQAEEDIVKSYKLYANCYVSKPVDFEQFNKAVKAIEGFWFAVVKLPPTDK